LFIIIPIDIQMSMAFFLLSPCYKRFVNMSNFSLYNLLPVNIIILSESYLTAKTSLLCGHLRPRYLFGVAGLPNLNMNHFKIKGDMRLTQPFYFLPCKWHNQFFLSTYDKPKWQSSVPLPLWQHLYLFFLTTAGNKDVP